MNMVYAYQSHTSLLPPLASKQGTVNSDCGCLQGEWTDNTETRDPPWVSLYALAKRNLNPT